MTVKGTVGLQPDIGTNYSIAKVINYNMFKKIKFDLVFF